MGFWTEKKVLVTGGHGFVGHAVLAELESNGCCEIIAPTSAESDLTKEAEVRDLFERTRPDVVLHLAGKVGGIGANRVAQGEFFYRNLMMGTLVLEQARLCGTKKLVALAAGCGYPKFLEAPFREADFWNGLPDENSVGYSMAKKMLIVQSWTYRDQYGFDSTILLPANLYGPHDNFDPETSHVVPALVRRFVEAVENDEEEVVVWGSGKASREFLYVRDTAVAILKTAESYRESGPLNLGTGQETSVAGLVEILVRLTGFGGRVAWDGDRPDGQPRRYYDMTLFESELKWLPDTSLEEGLGKTIEWYRENRERIRTAESRHA